MTIRTLKHPTTGEMIESEVVEVVEISNPPIQMVLADGSKLRLKLDVIEVSRVPGQWDAEGFPMYVVRSAKAMAVLESPPQLTKDG